MTVDPQPPVRQRRTEVETGMTMMAVAMLMVPAIDALAKSLGETVPTGQISASRFLFQTLFLAPLVLLGGHRFQLAGLPVQAARGALIALVTVLFFTSLRFLPLADAIAIFFVEPLILTLLSAAFLGEPVGWRRLLAVAVGFGGALMVIQPSFEEAGWPAFLPLGAAFGFASYLVLTRRLAQAGDAVAMQFYAGVFGCLTMVAVMAMAVGLGVGSVYFVPVWPTTVDWLKLAGLGAVATAGHLLVVHALRRAPAGVVAPFQYLEIISATLLGYVFFDDFPTPEKWLGIAVIIGSGLYVFHRERLVARRLAD